MELTKISPLPQPNRLTISIIQPKVILNRVLGAVEMDQKYLLLLQRTLIQFPIPTWQLKDLTLSSDRILSAGITSAEIFQAWATMAATVFLEYNTSLSNLLLFKNDLILQIPRRLKNWHFLLQFIADQCLLPRRNKEILLPGHVPKQKLSATGTIPNS